MAAICTGPATLDWHCAYAGDDVRAVLQMIADGDPWDLTGATLLAQVRESRLADDPPALVATINDIDASSGQFEVVWDGESIRSLLGTAETWEGVWDLQVTSVGGVITTVAAGKFLAQMDVSR